MRGSLLVLEELCIVIGAIISYWVTYGTRTLAGDAGFRVPFGLQMVPASLLGICIHLFPYSPRWLVMADRADDSLKAISKLRRLPADDTRVQAEWRSIIGEVAYQRELTERHYPGARGVKLELLGWFDLFKKDTYKRTIVAAGICFFTQFSGINAFVYYAPTLFTKLGQNYNHSIILAGMINIGQMVGVVPAMIFMDNIGRRNLAIWGAIAMAIPHTIMAGISGKYENDWLAHTGVGWFGVALVCKFIPMPTVNIGTGTHSISDIYVIAFGFSYGPLIWTLPSEVFQNVNRAKGVGFAVAISWLSNFIIGVCVPPMIENIKYGTYIFFAAFCFLAAIFAYFLVPETANKTLEELDILFSTH